VVVLHLTQEGVDWFLRSQGLAVPPRARKPRPRPWWRRAFLWAVLSHFQVLAILAYTLPPHLWRPSIVAAGCFLWVCRTHTVSRAGTGR
jgi:hypothetical protein